MSGGEKGLSPRPKHNNKSFIKTKRENRSILGSSVAPPTTESNFAKIYSPQKLATYNY